MEWNALEVDPNTGKSYSTKSTKEFTGDLKGVDQTIKQVLYTKQKENIAKQQDFMTRQQTVNQ
jgi:hypothetical protein